MEILEEEKVETALRKAEQEAQKGINMELHADEIQQRPRRTWFITKNQKRDIREKAKQESLGFEPNENKPEEKKLSSLEKKKLKTEQALKEHREKVRKRDNAIQTAQAKAVKRQQREKHQMMNDLPGYLEDEFSPKEKTKKKRKKPQKGKRR